MSDKKAQEIIQVQKQMEEVREPRESVWQDIIDYILPGLDDLLQQTQPGGRTGTDVYDGTGISALQLFADGLFGYLVSPAIAWFRLRMARPELNEIHEIREWLQAVEQHLYVTFARSNWYDAMSTYFEYGGAVGTAALYSEEDLDEARIVYTVPHPGEIYIAENRYGRVSRVHRKVRLEAHKAVEMFNDNVSPGLRDSAGSSPYARWEFIHAVYPRRNRDASKKDARNKRFASVWVEVAQEKIARESGYDMNPYGVWRFKRGTTPYGISPAEDALVEVMGLNEIGKSLLGAAQLAVEPAYNVPAEMQGNVRIKPRGMNYYDDDRRVISPVHTGINYPIGVDREQDKRKAVEKHFRVEFFTLLANIQGRNLTATEVIEMQGEKAAVLARPINRLNNECLDPQIDRAFQIELNAGRLPEPPDILYELGGEEIDVDYMGPLAQAQKRLFEQQGYQHGLNSVTPFAQLRPEVLDIIDFDESARAILQTHGFPQKAIRPREVVDKLRQARARAQAQETQKEDLLNMAGGVKTLAEADRASEGALSQALAAAQQGEEME